MKGTRLKVEIAQSCLSDSSNHQSEISNLQFKRRRGWVPSPQSLKKIIKGRLFFQDGKDILPDLFLNNELNNVRFIKNHCNRERPRARRLFTVPMITPSICAASW
jgi:hypothetical protein